MEITWYGRACFRLKGKDATVITDPCPPSTGFVAGKHDVDVSVANQLAEVLDAAGVHDDRAGDDELS